MVLCAGCPRGKYGLPVLSRIPECSSTLPIGCASASSRIRMGKCLRISLGDFLRIESFCPGAGETTRDVGSHKDDPANTDRRCLAQYRDHLLWRHEPVDENLPMSQVQHGRPCVLRPSNLLPTDFRAPRA